MRSKEAFACSRSTGYFCSVAADHPAPRRRVTPRRAGACHDTTGVERHDLLTNAASLRGSVPADTQRVKESPGAAPGALEPDEERLVSYRRPDTIPKQKSGKARPSKRPRRFTAIAATG